MLITWRIELQNSKYNRINTFNVPDQDHSEYINFNTVLDDIAIIHELGFVFNGRFKTEYVGKCKRKNLKYYVAHDCGHCAYRTIASMKKSKTKVCGHCNYDLNRKKITDGVRNMHMKKKAFYESILIKGAKILEVIHKKDKHDKYLYILKIKCACGGITEKRPGDLVRYYNPKKNLKRVRPACKLCGTYLGLDYGDYAPIKSMIKRLEKEIEDVESRYK